MPKVISLVLVHPMHTCARHWKFICYDLLRAETLVQSVLTINVWFWKQISATHADFPECFIFIWIFKVSSTYFYQNNSSLSSFYGSDLVFFHIFEHDKYTFHSTHISNAAYKFLFSNSCVKFGGFVWESGFFVDSPYPRISPLWSAQSTMEKSIFMKLYLNCISFVKASLI